MFRFLVIPPLRLFGSARHLPRTLYCRHRLLSSGNPLPPAPSSASIAARPSSMVDGSEKISEILPPASPASSSTSPPAPVDGWSWRGWTAEELRSELYYAAVGLAGIVLISTPILLFESLQEDVFFREQARADYPAVVAAISYFLDIPSDLPESMGEGKGREGLQLPLDARIAGGLLTEASLKSAPLGERLALIGGGLPSSAIICSVKSGGEDIDGAGESSFAANTASMNISKKESNAPRKASLAPSPSSDLFAILERPETFAIPNALWSLHSQQTIAERLTAMSNEDKRGSLAHMSKGKKGASASTSVVKGRGGGDTTDWFLSSSLAAEVSLRRARVQRIVRERAAALEGSYRVSGGRDGGGDSYPLPARLVQRFAYVQQAEAGSTRALFSAVPSLWKYLSNGYRGNGADEGEGDGVHSLSDDNDNDVSSSVSSPLTHFDFDPYSALEGTAVTPLELKNRERSSDGSSLLLLPHSPPYRGGEFRAFIQPSYENSVSLQLRSIRAKLAVKAEAAQAAMIKQRERSSGSTAAAST